MLMNQSVVIPAQAEALALTAPARGLDVLADPQLLRQLGIGAGDWVVVSTPSVSIPLRVVESDDIGASVIRLDDLARRSLGVSVGTDVQLAAIEPHALDAVTVEVDERLSIDPEDMSALLREHLAGMAVADGKVIALPIGPDGSLVLLRFTDISADAGVFGLTTHLHIHSRDLHEFVRPATGGLEEVGGNEQAVSELREVVQLAIERPEVFSRLGIRPSRGVILHGPPGTGKSLLCRSLAGEIDAAFYYISGPEVVGSLHGQTEESLRAVFNDAIDHAPSIICIDEVDALTSNRQSLSSQADMRAVAQLLALMDGLRRAPGVFVVGTTNQIDKIDPAFRRPGRFDREVAVDVPDEAARLEILHVHTRAMPLSAKALAGLPELARTAVGYTGADLWALCQRAGVQALRRVSEEGGLSRAQAQIASSESVNDDDFAVAFAEVKPAAARDGHLIVPEHAEMAGKTPAVTRLRELAGSVLAGQAGPLGAGVLLAGPSGVGKTTAVTNVAAEVGARLIRVSGSELASRWMGDTEASVRHIANMAMRLRPAIVVLDNLEAMAPKPSSRAAAGDVRLNGQLAAVISDLAKNEGTFVVGVTAHPELVDEALLGATGLRVGIAMGLPDEADRRDIWLAILRDLGRPASKEEVARVVDASRGLTASDLRTAAVLASSREASDTEVGFVEAALAELDGLGSLPNVADLAFNRTNQEGNK